MPVENEEELSLLKQDSKVGDLVLTLPGELEPKPIPIIRVERVHNQQISPNGFYGVLTPYDKKERTGYIVVQYKDGNITKYSTVVASACEGNADKTVLDKIIIQVYNVAPQDKVVEILININKDTRFRLQTIVYY